MRKRAIRPAPPSVILAFSPPVILAFSPPVILDISPPVILDISNRGSSVFVFGIRRPAADAANGKRHEMAPLQKRGKLYPRDPIAAPFPGAFLPK